MTVPWWKRLIYALIGWVTAMVVTLESFAIWATTWRDLDLGTAIYGLIGWLGFSLLLALFTSLPGLVIGIPIVLLVRNISGWRFWMYLSLGICIGPISFQGWALYLFFTTHNLTDVRMSSVDPAGLYLTVAVSSLTTLIYLLLLRRAQAVLGRKSMVNECAIDAPLL